jgi:hypothetical protein
MTPAGSAPVRGFHSLPGTIGLLPLRAKLRANISRSRAAPGVVRRLSQQVSAMWGGGGRCLAWFGFAS